MTHSGPYFVFGTLNGGGGGAHHLNPPLTVCLIVSSHIECYAFRHICCGSMADNDTGFLQ